MSHFDQSKSITSIVSFSSILTSIVVVSVHSVSNCISIGNGQSSTNSQNSGTVNFALPTYCFKYILNRNIQTKIIFLKFFI